MTTLVKPLVLVSGQIQRLQSGYGLDPSNLFDPTSNLGGISGLATNGITVHNGTAFSTVTLTAPASGMTITNASGTGGSPTFAFTSTLASLLALSNGMVAQTAAGTLTARTITGTAYQITVTTGDGVAGNPTLSLPSGLVLPGSTPITVPISSSEPSAVNGQMFYNSATNKFEFAQNGAWIEYGTSNTVGTVTSISVTPPVEGFTITGGPITSSGTFVFTLTDDLAGVEGLSTVGLAQRTSDSSWSTVVITGTSGNITVANGNGNGGNPTIDLATAGTPVTNQFVLITTDAYGRVTATDPVMSSDIIGKLGHTPLYVDGNNAMLANLAMGGFQITGLADPTAAQDAATQAYVLAQVAGNTWLNGLDTANVISDDVQTPPVSHANGDAYVVPFGATDAWSALVGHLVEWSGSAWVDLGDLASASVSVPVRFGVTFETSTTASGTLTGEHNEIWNITAYTHPTSFAGTGALDTTSGATITASLPYTPVQGNTTSITESGSYEFGSGFVYQSTGTHWVKFSLPGAIVTGIGLYQTGNTFNVSLGAGITQLPSGEVGIDLYTGTNSGALILTDDGSTSATDAIAQLTLQLNGGNAGTLHQDSAGLRVNESGITETQIAHSALLSTGGLTGGGGTKLAVDYDGVTLWTVGNVLQIKGNISNAMLVNTSFTFHTNNGDGTLTLGGSGYYHGLNGIQTAITSTSTANDTFTSIFVGGLNNLYNVTITSPTTGDILYQSTSTAITSFGSLVGGSGYTNGVYANVPLVYVSSGPGTGATADITVVGGAVTQVILINKGINYLASDSLTATPLTGVFSTTGNGTGFDIPVGTVTNQYVNGQPGSTSGVQGYSSNLNALSGLTSTPGLVTETGSSAFTTRVITGTFGDIVVTNGDGVSGNPTIDLASGIVTPGTYSSVTVDTYGRVTSGSVISAATEVVLTNNNAATVPIGSPVYIYSNGTFDLAEANQASTTLVIGLVAQVAGIAHSASGPVIVEGIITASTGEWDEVVTGESGGLVAGEKYYLSDANPGKMVTTAPGTTGSYIAPVGIAISATQMKVHVGSTVLL